MVLWFAAEPGRLSHHVIEAIRSAEERCVSLASAWEYSAKRGKFPGRLTLPFGELLSDEYRLLDLPFTIYRYADRLPPIHFDPFDRMLIAQALDLGLTLVTADKMIQRYPVRTLW